MTTPVPNAPHHKSSSDESMRPIVEALSTIGVKVTDCCDGDAGTSVFYVAMRIPSFNVLEQITRAIPLQFSTRPLNSHKCTLIIRGVGDDLDVILEGLFSEKDKDIRTATIDTLADCIRSIIANNKENQ